jgi:hypothetical protein
VSAPGRLQPKFFATYFAAKYSASNFGESGNPNERDGCHDGHRRTRQNPNPRSQTEPARSHQLSRGPEETRKHQQAQQAPSRPSQRESIAIMVPPQPSPTTPQPKGLSPV